MPTARLRVLLNACTMPDDATGISVYAYELASALVASGRCDVTFAAPSACPPGTEPLRPPTAINAQPRWWSAIRLQLWTQFAVPRLLRNESFDLFHGSEFSVPVFSRAPRVSTIHDLACLRAPRLFDTAHKRVYFRLMAETARTATAVIVPSAGVADDVMHEFGVPASRVHVTPLAARSSLAPASNEAVQRTTAAHGLGRPYVLCVGIWNRNKRIVDAIRAVANLKERGVFVDLALAGNAAPNVEPHYLNEVRKLGVADRVHFLGHVPDADLPALYSGALALVFPSEFEGFGLPPLEAMACGTPAIVSDIPAMRGHSSGAALMVPPRSPSAIALCINELLLAPASREQWVSRGLERSRAYTWERTAALTLEVYRAIV